MFNNIGNDFSGPAALRRTVEGTACELVMMVEVTLVFGFHCTKFYHVVTSDVILNQSQVVNWFLFFLFLWGNFKTCGLPGPPC